MVVCGFQGLPVGKMLATCSAADNTFTFMFIPGLQCVNYYSSKGSGK